MQSKISRRSLVKGALIAGAFVAAASPSLAAAPPAGYQMVNDCASSLPPGESCTITVNFEPTSLGPTSAVVTVASQEIQPMTVELSGTGRPDLKVTPATMDFEAPKQANKDSPQQATLIARYGPVTIDSLTRDGGNAGDFSVNNGTCGKLPHTLALNASCTFKVSFKPSSSGPRQTTLYINSSVAQASVVLRGTGKGHQ